MSISAIAPLVSLFSFLAMAFLVWRKFPTTKEWRGFSGTAEEKEGSGEAPENLMRGLLRRLRSLPWERYEGRLLARTERVLVFSRRQILKLDARTARWIERIRKHRNDTLNGNNSAPIWEEVQKDRGNEAEL